MLMQVHGPHVDVEQRLVLVALVPVLLPELDDLLEDLDVEALALGLGEHFLLALIQLDDLPFQLLDALHEGAHPIARHPNLVGHARPPPSRELQAPLRR